MSDNAERDLRIMLAQMNAERAGRPVFLAMCKEHPKREEGCEDCTDRARAMFPALAKPPPRPLTKRDMVGPVMALGTLCGSYEGDGWLATVLAVSRLVAIGYLACWIWKASR